MYQSGETPNLALISATSESGRDDFFNTKVAHVIQILTGGQK